MNHRPPPYPEPPPPPEPRLRCSKCRAWAILRRVRKPQKIVRNGELAFIYPSILLCEVCIYTYEVL